MNDPSPSVVITGAAIASGLGLSRQQTWDAILRGECALRPLTTIESPLPPGADGGEALPLPEDFAPDLPREARYLKWTLTDAIRDAALGRKCPTIPPTALRLSAGDDAARHARRRAISAQRRSRAPSVISLPATRFSWRPTDWGLAAWPPASAPPALPAWRAFRSASPCSSPVEADLVIAGGYDAIGEYVYGGFNSLRLVAPGPLRPFARDRQGMKLAEGYGIVVLERSGDADAARRDSAGDDPGRRGNLRCSSSHPAPPAGRGRGTGDELALHRPAGRTAADIDLVAAHATGTPDNDAGEFAAFSRVFGERLSAVPVVAFKSHLGHTLGGAGAVELILSAMALRDQIIPGCRQCTRR